MTSALASDRASRRSHREEGDGAHDQKPAHKSVMIKEVLAALAVKDGDVVVDATYGVGGHSKALKTAAKIKLIAIDADPRDKDVIKGNFADLENLLAKAGIQKIDKILFDLGWNLEQLGAGKGFSFLADEPLNMSYGTKPASGFTAQEILNTWDEKVLADVFFGYGEERYARRIAKAILERRKIKPIDTTIELVEIIKDAVPPAYRHGRIHPATRTFQALRIAVNDELGVLQKGLESAWRLLGSGGRIVVITFHSIEDRLVKRFFAQLNKDGGGRLIYKKPLAASREEIIHNPSARSAKLRAIEKI
ncbi:MAG: 16S rRNA (cytosine(1402)-N(4))-methyltransferase RsmH [Patescibacteria group bacterium]|nr:16S rRNA (cytosine(1402)-N(4))-methyltransferase RsmH [Patescibacteria group bacterium]